jgi:hypothetical protein
MLRTHRRLFRTLLRRDLALQCRWTERQAEMVAGVLEQMHRTGVIQIDFPRLRIAGPTRN